MLARSVAFNLAGQFGSLAIGFVSSIVLARLLGPADRGLLALLISVSELTFVLGGLGLPLAVMFFASRPVPQTAALLGNSLVYAAALAVVLVPAFFLLREPLGDALARGEGGSAWALVAAIVSLNFLNWTTRNQLVGALRFGLSNVLVVASKAMTLLGVVILVGLLDWGVVGGLVATGLGSLLSIAASSTVLMRRVRPELDRGLFRQMVGYGVRVQAGALFSTINTRLDVLVLQAFRPLSHVGYYVVAQVVAELVIVLARAFQGSVLPLVAREEGRGATTAVALRHHSLLAAAAVVAYAGFGTLVILYAYGDAFRPALEPMLILLPGMWFLGTGNVVASDLGGRGRPGTSSALAALAAGLTLVLDLILIPPYGVTGAAIASVCAYAVYGVVSLVVLSRVAGIPVRDLVVPRRDDLRVYGRLLRRR